MGSSIRFLEIPLASPFYKGRTRYPPLYKRGAGGDFPFLCKRKVGKDFINPPFEKGENWRGILQGRKMKRGFYKEKTVPPFIEQK